MQANDIEKRVAKYFSETTYVKFDDLPTSLICGRVTLEKGTEIDHKVLFDNIQAYTIPGYKRPNTIEVKLPYPGIPYQIVSVRMGTQVKGIVKNRNSIKTTKKNGKLSNRVSMDISISDRLVNIMVFPNMIKVSGGTSKMHIAEACFFFKALVLMIEKRGHKVFKKIPIATEIIVDMVNISFDLGYSVNLNAMQKFFARSDPQAVLPLEKEALQIEYPMGCNKSNGDPRYYMFRVRHSGKVMFTGDSRENMRKWYNKFIELVEPNQAEFRFD